MAWRALALGLVVLLGSREGHGDSWMPPRTFERKSSGGEYVVTIKPALRGDERMRIAAGELAVRKAGDAKLLWRAKLSNEVSPTDAMVSDDGRVVVTFDNWYGTGTGPDVLAFYEGTGQRRKYSLEELLKGGGIDAEGARIQRSVSSTWWREHGVQFFHTGKEGRPRLCVWLSWAQKWLAWELPGGEVVEATAARVGEWNEEARRHALKDVESRSDVLTAAKFLAWLKDGRDRRLFEEKLLKSTDFENYWSTQTGGRSWYGAKSEVREIADAALAHWPGVEPKGAPPREGAEVKFALLGEVRGALRLPVDVKGRDVAAAVYLVPEGVGAQAWQEARPVHRVLMELGDRLMLGNRPVGADRKIEFRIEGVTPGRYWVKAVYDVAEPYCESWREDAMCVPGPGDYEGARGEAVKVVWGEVADVGVVECSTEVPGKGQ